MEKNFILNRRTVLGGAAALGTVGVLAACGSSKDSKATTKGATVGTDAKELYDLAEACLLYTSPSPRDMRRSRMPSSA